MNDEISKEEIRKDKLLSIQKMKERNYSDEFIQDILNLDDETFADLMKENLDREDPFRKAKEKFAKYYVEKMGWTAESSEDLAIVLTHMYYENEGIEKTKERVLSWYKDNKEYFTVKRLSELNDVAEWKIQEWIDEWEEE